MLWIIIFANKLLMMMMMMNWQSDSLTTRPNLILTWLNLIRSGREIFMKHITFASAPRFFIFTTWGRGHIGQGRIVQGLNRIRE
jgi:hypothetical protein